MIIEKGVEMISLCDQMKKILKIIDLIYYESGSHMIIIAAKWAKDSHRVAHESGRAIDIMRPEKGWPDLFFKLKDALGINYIVWNMEIHLHIEWSPLGLVKYDGTQNRPGKAPLPCYTDHITRSSFMVPEGQHLIGALKKVREKFERQEASSWQYLHRML